MFPLSFNRVVIGLYVGFPFNSTDSCVGYAANSFAISSNGDYCASGTKTGFGTFDDSDVVGCGLLVLPTGRRLFFTKNGDLWGKNF